MRTFEHLDHYTEIINGISFDMIFIKGGTFTCGDGSDDDNKPQVLTVPDFWIGETQVTQELWQTITNENPSFFQSPKRPVDSVSWVYIHDKFLGKFNELAQKNNSPCLYTLPSESCWEYAAQAGENTKYSDSDNVHEVAWFRESSRQCTQEVALKPPNAFGLYNMSGNVREWTNTIYEENNYENYLDTSKNDSIIIYNKNCAKNSSIVLRGSSWYYVDYWFGVSYRYYSDPTNKDYFNGFRLFSFVSAKYL